MSATQDQAVSDQAPRPGPGRKRKYSLDEVRRRMVEASVEQLLASGISAGLDPVRLDRIVVEAEIPRGSAYEAWDHPDRSPQENLRHATVLHILRTTTANNADPTRAFAMEVLTEVADEIGSGDLERKRRARAEVTRRVAEFNHTRLNSNMWTLYRALCVVSGTRGQLDPDIAAALDDGENRLVEAYTGLFNELAALLSMELRPGRTMEHFALSVVALNDGLANHTTDAFGQDRQRLVLDDGQPWTLFAVGVEALYDAFFTMHP